MLSEVSTNLLEKGISLEVADSVKGVLVEKGYDFNFGARPLRRVIQDNIEDRLSEELLRGKIGPGGTVVVDVDSDDEIVLRTEVALPSG